MSENLKELFKSKYGFIKFETSSEIDSRVVNFDHDHDLSSMDFYNEIINTQSSLVKETNDGNQKEIVNNDHIKKSSFIFDPKEFLKAAQDNDLNYISESLQIDHLALNLVDNFKWNILMIATASFNNKIVQYLLQKQNCNPSFVEFLSHKDSAGQDTIKIAENVGNKNALAMILDAKKALTEGVRDVEEILEVVNNQGSEYYCETCKIKIYVDIDEHSKSIAHLLNESNEIQMKRSFHLRASNKGYQLLCKSGWNEQSGLGSHEQGLVYPVQIKAKFDRIGITTDQPISNKISPKVIFGLKKGVSNNDDRVEAKFKIMRNLTAQKLKDQKSKKLERNLRFYFNN